MLKSKKNLAQSKKNAARSFCRTSSIIKFIFISSTFLVIGCAVNYNNTKKQSYPDWIYGTFQSDGICYVGSSLPHIRGKSYQRALAISRALDGIAMQKKVVIDVDIEHLMVGTSESVSSTMQVYSVQTTKGETVSAKIREVWIDPYTEELFILMCEE